MRTQASATDINDASSHSRSTDSTTLDAFGRWRSACAALLGPASFARSRPYPDRRYNVRSAVEGAESSTSLADWMENHQDTEEDMIATDRCNRWKDELLRTSPMIRFMVRQLSLVSCDPLQATPTADPHAPPKLYIATCPPIMAGGFNWSDPGRPTSESGILICANRIMNKRHLEDTLAHEMIHWWDHCRFKVDFANLRHHACTEIRAASLSGDCNLSREWGRHWYGFTKQHQVCARRRAIKSVASHPDCPGEAAAERAVDEVWDSCFSDTRPFDEIY